MLRHRHDKGQYRGWGLRGGASPLDGLLVSIIGAVQSRTPKYLVEGLCCLTGWQVEPVFASSRLGHAENSLASAKEPSEKPGITKSIRLRGGLFPPVASGTAQESVTC